MAADWSRRFLTEGPPRTLPDDVIAFLAARHVSKLLTEDDALRRHGIGMTSLLEPIRREASASLLIPGTEPPPTPSLQAGMTLDDLDFMRFAVERLDEKLRLAVALRNPPDSVRSAVEEALSERGVEASALFLRRDAATQAPLSGEMIVLRIVVTQAFLASVTLR